MTTCRADGCGSPSQSLPENLVHLGVPFCAEHTQRLQLAAADARRVFDEDSFVRSAVVRAAQNLVFPTVGHLTVIEGGIP